MKKTYLRYDVVWSPEGRTIAVVVTESPERACKLAPLPYRRYQRELYAVLSDRQLKLSEGV